MQEKVVIAKALGIYTELDLAGHPRPVRGLRGAHPAHGVRHGGAAERGDPRWQVGAVRRRSGHHARYRPWHVPVRHFVERQRGRRLHRHRRRAHAHRRRDRGVESLHHARWRRAVPHRSAGRRGRPDSQARQRIRRGDRPSAALRMVRCAAAALYRRNQRLRQHGGNQTRRARRIRRDPGVRGVSP